MDSEEKRKSRVGRRPVSRHGGLRHGPSSRRDGSSGERPQSGRSGRHGPKSTPKAGGTRSGRRVAAAAKVGPSRRSAGAKISAPAARAIRSGHPWVFRDALSRSLPTIEDGALIPISDPEGYHLAWGLYESRGAVALRIVGHEANFKWTNEEQEKRLQAALQWRERFAEPAIQGACRLVHGEADGFPGLAVDRLGDFALIYKYSQCAESYLDDFVQLLAKHCELQGIYMQDRLRPVQPGQRRPPAFHMHGKKAPPEYEVQEDGLSFVVDVTAPVSPGLFLDLREGRRMFETRAAGKRVLNLFSFTGPFGVRAARAGAAEIVNVDAAARSHARCRQNLSASGLDPESCQALNGDVFKHLEKMRTRGRRFDLVVVDPPPFSNVDGNVFSALKDWARLMKAVAEVTEDKGEVLAVCNAATLSGQEFLNAVGEGLSMAKRNGALIGELGLPPDFPVIPAFGEGRYLKIKHIALD